MITKFETKSNRVKGLCFHPTRPWILASLHSGVIQLWDYRIRMAIDRFDEHDGPVRGVCFHLTQPLFVSGGDDYKIKVWNYKQRRCLFTLLGHLDYIRTVQFHHEYPWILSASDDQTIRIWNWQSRTCVAVLAGHNHYVMCASFHPKDDLVVSASLDQTVRVWDISGLRRRNISPAGGVDESLRLPQNELFGTTDAVVKYVLEGHDRGVNWAAFHPTIPLIVSGADDRQVKLWRTNETKAWEVDTLRGHFNNVSCAIFHPRQEYIISNSEDKTIRVWDMGKRSGVQTFRRDHDRFWILCAHPEQNVFAAGHDSGLIVFKLERERPAHTTQGNILYYIKDRYLRAYDFNTYHDSPIIAIRKPTTLGNTIRSISYNPAEKYAIICSDSDGGTYELYTIPKDPKSNENVESKRGLGTHGIFIARGKFAVLVDKQIYIKNLKNEVTKRITLSDACDAIFPAQTGCLLLKCDDKIISYDVQQRKILAEIIVPNVRYVAWSTHDKGGMVALIAKEGIIIATKKLEQLCTIQETVRIKSGSWEEHGVFIYNTLNHIKYCLPNGDKGIIRTLDVPIYLSAVKGNNSFSLDRESKIRKIVVNNTEYVFKLALVQRNYPEVLKMVNESNLIGQSIISYLQQKGFPEVALHFVKDPAARFNLGLECGNIEVGLAAAKELDQSDCWNKLAVEALRQGNHQVVEFAYQKTKNFERLSFLYLITGNIEKLRRMLKIAEMRNDVMGRFHNALYLGDIIERIKALEEGGQTLLAYITAKTHDLNEIAETLLPKLNIEAPEIISNGHLLNPPIPIMRLHEINWPLLNVSKGYFDGAKTESKKFVHNTTEEEIEQSNSLAWQNEDIELPDIKQPEIIGVDENLEVEESNTENGWENDDLGDLPGLETNTITKTDNMFVPPNPGTSPAQNWLRNSRLPADHIAAGAFDVAMQLLRQQIGVVNFTPLKPLFMNIFIGSRVALPALPLVPSLVSYLQRPVTETTKNLPTISISLQHLIEQLKNGYKITTAGKFGEALSIFVNILQSIPLLVVESRKEVAEVKELIGICREYTIGLRMELYRKEAQTANSENPARLTELAAYFTHCNMQPIHVMLSLRAAMNAAFKIKNFITAASFSRRLLELNPKPDIATQARKLIQYAEQNSKDACKLNYDERNPFEICAISYTPIYKGSPVVKCPFCGSGYHPNHKGQPCPVCQLSIIGAEATGLQIMN
eukprot:TRINITY_DN813_c1_g1_i1.p1 TRINITY_DN813_c1_g1~~TRINITY_DN813_c1_g1_i1.p1  ORF type:complete len:1210 (-),score=610.19 TRINITY_DN813_c1_g1_i1:110-3739(-)